MNECGIRVADAAPRHVFLAPHYDDVALSCGGTVVSLSGTGDPPLIVTIFGGTPAGRLTEFAREMHDRWGVGPGDALAMRRREERCAAQALGAEAIWLEFLDAIYRGTRYTSDPAIFGDIHPDESDMPNVILRALVQRLGIERSGSHVFYLPLGIGNHVDHQHTLRVGMQLAESGHDVWSYEDFPYAGDPDWRDSIEQRASLVKSNESRLVMLTDAHMDRKVNAVRCYGSQLDIIFRHQGDPDAAMRRYARLVGGSGPAERYWRL